MIGRGVVAVAWLCAASMAAAQPAERAQTILHMLDYVAVDYPEFVRDGKVVDQSEYDEQLEFVTQVRALLEQLAARPERGELLARADRLVALVKDKRPGVEVADLANQLRWAIIEAYGVEVAPKRPPDLRPAAALYAAQCAACHGATGLGDGPAGQGLDPRPSNFHDRDRMAQRSVYGLYSTITLGVNGTGMASFRGLGEEQRWALAFYVANLGRPAADVRRGAELWQAGQGKEAFADLASIVTRSAREVEAQHGADAVALLGYLRTRPDVFAAGGNAALATSLRLLRESVDAYRQGRARQAQDLAVSSYLDGFELVEASLDALDRGLRTAVEAEMIRYRSLLRDGAPLPQVEAQAAKIEGLLGQARDLLDAGSLPAERHLPVRVRHPGARGAGGHPDRGRHHRAARQGEPPRRAALGPLGLDRGPAAGRPHVGRRLVRRQHQRGDARGDGGRHRAASPPPSSCTSASGCTARATRGSGRPTSRGASRAR